MEDLIATLSTSVQVSCTPNNTTAPHPRFAQYKQKKVEPQEERRRKFLEAQKKKRYNFVNHARCLAENVWIEDTEDDKIKSEDNDDDMDWISSPKRPSRSYKNQLMLSEWLVEVPSDIETKWLLVLCPEGKRSLIVSSQGQTKCYAKSGYLINNFPSLLPGGSRRQTGTSGYTLLDCIYNEQDRTYYILDIMCWNSHPVFDSETEFRFFWLQSKIAEIPEVTKASKRNPFKFIPLPSFSCILASIKDVMWSPLPFPAKLDGLLFYHKETHYTPGSTPLVGWLKAYMLPEILNITVPSSLCTDRPSQYISMEKHLSAAFNKRNKLENQKCSDSMECQEENKNKEAQEEMNM